MGYLQQISFCAGYSLSKRHNDLYYILADWTASDYKEIRKNISKEPSEAKQRDLKSW